MRMISLFLLLTLCISPVLGQQDEQESDAGSDDKKWVDLFNGEDTKGWKNPYDWGEIEVKDNEIRLTATKKFFLVTERGDFKDFVFEGEILLPEGQANSGFMFRCHVTKNKVFGYQAEVDGSARRWSGGLYDEGRRGWIWPSKKSRSKDEATAENAKKSQEHFKKAEVAGALDRNGWNKYRITCKGKAIKIEVNDVLITEIEDETDASGYLGIQHHGEKGQTYRFRNLKIREL